MEFTGLQARGVARGFASYVARSGIVVYACSILPKHVHVVVARHTYSIEKIACLLKGAATTELLREGLHPFAGSPYRDGTIPTPWARRQWSVFLGSDVDVARAFRYVNNNPLKERRRSQHWSFVSPLAGVPA